MRVVSVCEYVWSSLAVQSGEAATSAQVCCYGITIAMVTLHVHVHVHVHSVQSLTHTTPKAHTHMHTYMNNQVYRALLRKNEKGKKEKERKLQHVHVYRTQNIAGSSTARGSSSFSWGKKRVVFGCRCLHLPCLYK